MGSWQCADGSAEAASPSATSAPSDALAIPWQTGFEDGFCGYTKAGGFCYANPDASYELVSSPVHAGRFAAAFHVPGDPAQDGLQARCAQVGTLPQAAYYAAWFYVPSQVTSTNDWNLFHFDGNGADVHHDLWDVSLGVAADGSLFAYVYDFLRMTTEQAVAGAEVPVGDWFQLEVYWDRASDATGRFDLYVDGAQVLSLTGLVTDDSDGAEWYVGNFASELTPRSNTLYVDDVSISLTRGGS